MRILALSLSLLVLPALEGGAQASVVLALDLPALVRSSAVVGEIEVVSRHAVRWDDGTIATEYEAIVLQAAKGTERGATIGFFTEGGVLDGIGAVVAGEPRPRVGERIVAFLEETPAGLRFTGMSQGCLPVIESSDGPRVRPPRRGAVLVRRTPEGLVPARPAVTVERDLAGLLAEVEALATP